MSASGAGDSIVAAVRAHAAAGKTELPLFDKTGARLQAMLHDPEFDLGDAERLISSDPALTSELLRLANSSHFRGLEKTLSVGGAMLRLGSKEVLNLVLLIGHGKSYHLSHPDLRAHLGDLWRHAVATAVGTHWLLGKLSRPDLAARGFLAGLLHDVGKLFVLRVLDEIERPDVATLRAVAPELMASLHVEEGARLLQRWNVPDELCAVVRHHHDEFCDFDDPLTLAVRLTDQVCHAHGIGLETNVAEPAESEEARALRVPPKGVEALGQCVEQAVEMAQR